MPTDLQYIGVWVIIGLIFFVPATLLYARSYALKKMERRSGGTSINTQYYPKSSNNGGLQGIFYPLFTSTSSCYRLLEDKIEYLHVDLFFNKQCVIFPIERLAFTVEQNYISIQRAEDTCTGVITFQSLTALNQWKLFLEKKAGKKGCVIQNGNYNTAVVGNENNLLTN
jgi:hypothetical protein